MHITPKISVIMSVFNAGDYLSSSISSILNQSFKDFEFIIVDDNSSDNSLAIIESFIKMDKRIVLIKNNKNNGAKGFIKNLNTCIKKSKSQVIARMDADDISHFNRLKLQFLYLESHPEVSLVGTSVNLIDEKSQVIDAIRLPLNPEYILPKRNCIFHPTIMFRKDNLMYREKMLYCEDYDLYLRMLSDGKKIKNMSEILLSYRILPNSISRNKAFIQNIFSNKASEFFLERNNTSKDSYSHFNPFEYEKSIDINSPEGRIYQLKSFVYSNQFEMCRKMCKEYIKKYGFSLEVIRLYLISLIPKIVLFTYRKTRMYIRLFLP